MTRSPDQIMDGERIELAQQFKNVKDFSSYVVARIQQAEDAPIHVKTIEVSNVEETEEDAQPRKEKRIKGRRRADHPQVRVEAAMRRQSELKSAWRSMARPLKQILDEIGRRTTDELEVTPRAYERASEHEYVEAGLQEAYERRAALINRGYEYQRAQLEQRRMAEAARLKHQYQQTILDTQDRMLIDAEYKMLQIDRRTQRRHEADLDHETEDEDDVLLRPHRMSYRYDRGSALEPMYDSRSRFALELEQAQDRLAERSEMRNMLAGDGSDVHQPQFRDDDFYFTTMDIDRRSNALLHRQGVTGVNMLVKASEQVEASNGKSRKRRRQAPVSTSNQEAVALMDLAEVATERASQRASEDGSIPITPGRRPSMSVLRFDKGKDTHNIATRNSDQTRAGHKRRRSSLRIDSSPFFPRQYAELASLQESQPHIKNEPMLSPASHLPRENSESALVRPDASTSTRFEPGFRPSGPGNDDVASQPGIVPGFDTIRRGSIEIDDLSIAPHERRLSRSYRNEDNTGPGKYPHLGPPLASPFQQAAMPMFPPSLPPPPFPFDSEYGRSLLRHPPIRPTAQPINHFANGSIHRQSFGNPSTFPSWSPLVALPQQQPPPPSSPMQTFSNPWSYNDPYASQGFMSGPQHMQNGRLARAPSMSGPSPAPMLMPSPQQQQQGQQQLAPNQYGGLMLAPAGPARGSAQQPAFAQQLGRQEQSRRRNTESSFPKFKVYHGPNGKG